MPGAEHLRDWQLMASLVSAPLCTEDVVASPGIFWCLGLGTQGCLGLGTQETGSQPAR